MKRRLLWFLALSVAACLWLSFFDRSDLFLRRVRFENKKAEQTAPVSIPPPPTITYVNRPRSCVQIEKAIWEDGDILVYWRSACSAQRAWVELTVKLKASDNTVIHSNFTYALPGERIETGERYEKVIRVSQDPRANVALISSEWQAF